MSRPRIYPVGGRLDGAPETTRHRPDAGARRREPAPPPRAARPRRAGPDVRLRGLRVKSVARGATAIKRNLRACGRRTCLARTRQRGGRGRCGGGALPTRMPEWPGRAVCSLGARKGAEAGARPKPPAEARLRGARRLLAHLLEHRREVLRLGGSRRRLGDRRRRRRGGPALLHPLTLLSTHGESFSATVSPAPSTVQSP